jgi:hypothetical protein
MLFPSAEISVDASMVYMSALPADKTKEEDVYKSYIAVLARDVRSTIRSEAELIAAKRANEAKSNFVSSTLPNCEYLFLNVY